MKLSLAVARSSPLALLFVLGCAEGLADPTETAGAPGAGTESHGTTGGSSGGASSGANGGGNSGGSGSSSGGGSGSSSGGSGGSTAPSYTIDLSQTSVSGFSSGGYFAVQFHVAFSSIMKGAAIFAGGPFDCAQGSVATALTTCMSATAAPSATSAVATTKQMAASGLLDDPSHLSGQRVFLFGGASDSAVTPAVMDALDQYYGAFLDAASIQYESRHAGTVHTFPTTSYGNACGVSSTPWLSNCAYDGAGKALAQIYGTLAPPATTLGGQFVSIAQGDFVASPASHSLADTAYAYVPASCAAGETCRIHVSFHGCAQNVAGVGDAYYKHAGWNEWADTNHLVVLYPQTIASNGTPSNPNACWDWWGYDDADYANKKGAQMAMVRAMLDHLAGK
jgi:poly(3-hydroxybutyrate) depolymerase